MCWKLILILQFYVQLVKKREGAFMKEITAPGEIVKFLTYLCICQILRTKIPICGHVF